MALALAAAAGGVDAVGWLSLGHVFSAHMSGNTVSMMSHAAFEEWGEAGRAAFVIVAFVSGLVIGAGTAAATKRMRFRIGFSLALAIEAAMLFALMFVGEHASGKGGVVPLRPAGTYYALVALAAGSMGVQSATLRRVGGSRVHTTFVTGALVRVADGMVEFAEHVWHGLRLPVTARQSESLRAASRRAFFFGSLWVSYATGGVASGLLVRIAGMRALALPLLVVSAATIVDARLARAGSPEAGAD
ncbi:MAG: YoaK family protein [Polyangiaceae bacterium]|jgi:uncharacterized membrane protein YoaK (UPF0700 family)